MTHYQNFITLSFLKMPTRYPPFQHPDLIHEWLQETGLKRGFDLVEPLSFSVLLRN